MYPIFSILCDTHHAFLFICVDTCYEILIPPTHLLEERHGDHLNIIPSNISCIGEVESWHLHAVGVTLPVHVIFADIWRPETGDTFKLIGKNRLDVSSNGYQVCTILKTTAILCDKM